MKNYFLTAAITLTSVLGVAQQFGGSTTQTGAIFRTGTLGIGVSAVPSTVDVIIDNATNKASKLVLGKSTLTGTYQSTETVVQAHNQNSKKSSFNAISASSTTSNLSLSLDANLTGNTGISLSATTAANKKPFIFDMYGTNSMIITTTGQVGIGTGTAALGTMKLAVEGVIGAREVKVTLSNPWPDYVFDANYSRKSFDELSTYLQTEKHLPYIPSAKQVELEGTQSLGETQQNIVRSLEELYLYVLELKAENTELKKEINNLKNTTK